jgi:hypothetical protein
MCYPRYIWLAIIGAGSIMPLHAQQMLPVKQYGTWGYIDQAGQLRIPFQFTSAGFQKNAKALAWRNDSAFIIDTNFRVYSPGQFDALEPMMNGHWKGKRGGKFCICDSMGHPITGFFAGNIEPLSSNLDLYRYNTHYLSGVCNSLGETIVEPKYMQIKLLNDIYLSCLLPNDVTKIYHLKSRSMYADSFTSFKHIGGVVYVGTRADRGATLISEDTRIIGSYPNCVVENFNIRFASVHVQGSAITILDLQSGLFIDGLPYPANPVCDSFFIASNKGTPQIYHLPQGWVGDFQADDMRCHDRHFEVLKNSLWGLADGNYQLALPQTHTALNKHHKYFLAKNIFGLWAIFSAEDNRLKTPYKYIHYTSHANQIKAYITPTSADYFEVDDRGNIIDSLYIPNLRTVYVRQRIHNRESVDPVSNRFSLNRQWYSESRIVKPNTTITRWGLRAYEADTWRILRKPGFEYIFGLNNGTTVAGNTNFTNTEPFPFNISKRWQVHEQRIITDSTGAQLGRTWNFVDLTDFDDDNLDHFRAHAAGRAWLVGKCDHTPLLQATYISPIEFGIRRVCHKGEFILLEKPATNIPFPFINDRQLLVNLGINRSLVYPRKGTWQLRLKDGRLVTPGKAEYNVIYIQEFKQGYAIFHLSNGLCGVTDTLGREIVPPEYSLIDLNACNPQDGIFCYRSVPGKFGIARKDGTLLTPPVYSFVNKKGDAIFCRSTEELNCVDAQGTLHNLHKGKNYVHFNRDNCFAGKRGKMQVCDIEGNPLSDLLFENPMPFEGDYAFAMHKKHWVMVNRKGEINNKHTFPSPGRFTENRIWFRKNNKLLSTNLEGRDQKLVARNANVVASWEQVVAVEKNKRYALFTEEGKPITRFRFKYIPVMTMGGIACITTGTCRFFQTDGSAGPIFNLKHRITHADILLERSVYKYRKSNTYAVTFEAAQVYAWTGENSGPIVINTNIHVAYKVQRDYVWEAVQNDVYLVYVNNNYFYIRGSGSLLTNASFLSAKPMNNGLAICEHERKNNFGILDKYGNWAMAPMMKNIHELSPNFNRYTNNYQVDIHIPGNGRINSESYDIVQRNDRKFFLQRGNASGWFEPGKGIIYDATE